MSEITRIEAPKVIASEWVELAIGVEKEGARYTKVRIDEMCGLDEENMGSPGVQGNPGKALTILLRRAIQEIPGVVEAKDNPNALLPEDVVLRMFQPDRDVLARGIYALSPDIDALEMDYYCAECDEEWTEIIHLADIPIKQWPANMPPVIPFELVRGLNQGEAVHKKGELRIPTGYIQEQVAPFAQKNMALGSSKMLEQCVTHIGELEITTFTIKALRSTDRRYLSDTLLAHLPGLQLRVVRKHTCGREVFRQVSLNDFFSSRQRYNEISSTDSITG